jgi:hypothetical protein
MLSDHDNRHNEYRDNDKLDVDPTTPMHVLFGRNFGERFSRGQFLVRHVQVLTFQGYVEERGSCPTHAAMPKRFYSHEHGERVLCWQPT